MKKLLISVATAGLTLIPAVSAHAMSQSSGCSCSSYNPSTNISQSQDQSASLNARKNNSNSSSNTTYYNQAVNYEALSYVKYSASTTAYSNSMQNSQNKASLMANYMNNNQSQFSMPSYLSQYSN